MTSSLSAAGRRLLAAIALSAALAVVGWHAVLGPRAVRVSEKREALSALEARVRVDGPAPGRAATLSDTLRVRQRRLARARARWESPSTVTAWLEAVAGLARTHGLQLHGFKPMPGTDDTNPASWQATFDLEGAYQPLRRFLGALEEDASVDVMELTLSVAARASGHTRLRASCVLARVRLPERGAS